MGGSPFFIGFEKVGLNRKEAELEALLQPVVEIEGCEIWGIEYLSQGRFSKLRLYIDKPEDDVAEGVTAGVEIADADRESAGGVTVDDCARVSRRVSDVLDVEEIISGGYTLEVSSPGMDRILFKPVQYESCIGEQIEVRLNFPVEGRKRVTGVLVGLENGEAIVQFDEDEYLLPLENVARARVVPRFD